MSLLGSGDWRGAPPFSILSHISDLFLLCFICFICFNFVDVVCAAGCVQFWGEKTGEGTMVLVGNAWNKAEWTNKDGYVLTPSFWYFAHFSRFIRPGMKRVDALSPRGDILSCAFVDANSGAVVLISTSHQEIQNLRVAGVPDSLMKQQTAVYQSTPTSRMRSLGKFNGDSVHSIPPCSITTIAFGPL